MNDTKTYTAPAVIASTDAVQNIKGPGQAPGDGADGFGYAPGSIGFSL